MNNFNLAQLKVVYVDTNERSHSVVRSILNAMGIKNFNSLTDLSKLFDELSHRPPDILVTEYKLDSEDEPDLSGLELIRKIRQDEKSPDPYLPVILLTGHTERRIVAAARDAGAHHVLAKPISIQQFYLAICWLVSNPVPFVQSGEYYGPDRRRKERKFDGEDRRGSEAETPTQPENEQSENAPPDEAQPEEAKVSGETEQPAEEAKAG